MRLIYGYESFPVQVFKIKTTSEHFSTYLMWFGWKKKRFTSKENMQLGPTRAFHPIHSTPMGNAAENAPSYAAISRASYDYSTLPITQCTTPRNPSYTLTG